MTWAVTGGERPPVCFPCGECLFLVWVPASCMYSFLSQLMSCVLECLLPSTQTTLIWESIRIKGTESLHSEWPRFLEIYSWGFKCRERVQSYNIIYPYWGSEDFISLESNFPFPVLILPWSYCVISLAMSGGTSLLTYSDVGEDGDHRTS